MKRVLLLGYFGAGNLGDDGLLVDWLQRFGPAMRQRAIQADVVSSGADLFGSFSEADRVRDLVGSAVERRKLLSISPQKYTALIAPGGSVLQDSTSLRSLLYYLFVIRRFALAGVPVFLLNQGLGPFNSAVSRWLTPRILAQTRVVSVRDSQSLVWLEQQRELDSHPALIQSCDALLAARLGSSAASPNSSAEPHFMLIIPKATGRPAYDSHLNWDLTAMAEALREEHAVQTRVMSLHPGADDKLAADIAAAAQGQLAQRGDLSCLFSASIVLSFRLHGAVLAASRCIPALGIAYDPKVSAFCDSLELPWVNYGEMVGQQWADGRGRDRCIGELLRLWDNRQTIMARMSELRSAQLDRLEAAERAFEAAWLG